jgi:hypothetical protein
LLLVAVTYSSRKEVQKMTERQSTTKGIISSVVPALIALIGVVVGSLLTSQLGFYTQLKITGKQKRQQAYSELMAKKAILTQLITSYLVANTYFQHQEGRWWLAQGTPDESIHLEEARKWMNEAGELILEIAKSRQSFYETLGLIRSYFPYSPQLKELTYKIYHYKIFEVKQRPYNMDAEQLQKWRDKTINEIQEINDELNNLIDNLVRYLESEIEKEAG